MARGECPDCRRDAHRPACTAGLVKQMKEEVLAVMIQHLSVDELCAYLNDRDAVLEIGGHTHTPALDTVWDFAPDGCLPETWEESA